MAESGLNGFYLSNSENDALSRVSDSGLVVVTQVSQDKVEGIILCLNLANAFGDITDTSPGAPSAGASRTTGPGR